jgi:hypothetical protein
MGDNISGQRALAKALSVSLPTAHKYVHDPRWKFGRGPWDRALTPKMRQWQDVNYRGGEAAGATDSDDPAELIAALGPLNKAKFDVLVKRAAKLEIENMQAMSNLLPKEEVDRGRIERITAVKVAMQQACVALPRLFAGKSENELIPMVEAHCREICNAFAVDN